MSNCLSVVSTVHLLDHLWMFVCMLPHFFSLFSLLLKVFTCCNKKKKNKANNNIIKQKKNKSHPYIHTHKQVHHCWRKRCRLMLLLMYTNEQNVTKAFQGPKNELIKHLFERGNGHFLLLGLCVCVLQVRVSNLC